MRPNNLKPNRQILFFCKPTRHRYRRYSSQVHWTVEIAKDWKRKPLKKDSYDLQVRVIKAKKTDGESNCCHRKAFRIIAFIHRDSGRRRITRFFGLCRTHYELLEIQLHGKLNSKYLHDMGGVR